MSVLEVEKDAGVRVVRMARPERKNAVNLELHTALTEVWGELATDPDAKAVLLHGLGGAFSAGGDADWLLAVATDPVERHRSLEEAKKLCGEMLRFPLPIVAGVEGPAVGLGSSLASLCDLVIMGESAFFKDPHVALGVVAGDGAVVTWPYLMSMMKAKEYLYTGAKIDARTAVDLGLATRVVPDADVVGEAAALAHRLAELPTVALQSTKRALNMHMERVAIGIMDYATAAEGVTFGLPDIQEKLVALGKGAK